MRIRDIDVAHIGGSQYRVTITGDTRKTSRTVSVTDDAELEALVNRFENEVASGRA